MDRPFRFLFIITLSLIHFQNINSQTKGESELDNDSLFIHSKTVKSQTRYAYSFFNDLKNYDLETFIKKRELKKEFRRNKEFILNYDSIRYFMLNCDSKDTSIYFTYELSSKKEKITTMHVLIKHKCPMSIDKNLQYNAKLLFYNRQNGKLIGIEPKFYTVNNEGLPKVPTLINKNE